MITDRQKDILRIAIEEYLHTAHPVASKEIVKKYKLNISPATVRWEFYNLTRSGYLEQPHISAGRVPTDRGYRFFVDNLIEEKPLSPKEEQMIENALSQRRLKEFIQNLGKVISQISRTFTATGIKGNILYKTGLSQILYEPEFSSEDYIRMLGELADFLDEKLQELDPIEDENNEYKVFIGKENPFREGRKYSMLMSSWSRTDCGDGIIVMIAPKRTNYPKHFALLKHIRSRILYQ